ncbi:MAG: SBBP repeat-containing protein [Ignavibacteria bacterium]|nr:SBBP repeat-containing protein [Ignavibacteria bacterium]
MKKLIVIFAAIILIILSTDFSHSQVNLEWQRSYIYSPSNNKGKCIEVDNLGNSIVSGLVVGDGVDIITLKYDPSGSLLWSKRYTDLSGYLSDDGVSDMVVDNQRNIYVTGYTANSIGGNKNFLTIKYSPSGSVLWTRKYQALINYSDKANAICLDANNNVYVTGYSMGLGTAEDYQLVKYDNNGNLQWVRRYNSPHNNVDIPNDMDVDIAGNVYVTGQSYLNNSTIISYFTIKYNSAGTELWTKRSGLDARNDVATSISVDKSQNAYVTGTSNGVTIAGLTYKYDVNGNEVWAASYVNQQDIPIVRVVDEDDVADESNIVVSTSNNEFYQTTGYDYLTIKYNGISGDTLWKRRFNHINSFDNVLAMTVDSDGNVYVTGKSYDNTSSFDMATIKYDGISGNTLWYQRYNAGGDDIPNDIAIGLDGAVYLAGQNSYGSLQVLKYFQSNPLPTVTVSPDVSICSGSSATLTAGGAISYEWSPSTGLNTTTGTSVVASPSSTTTYTVTGTDANGYTNTATVTVTVNPLPTVTASPNVSICSGSSATLTGSGASSYEWSPSAGLNTTSGSTVIANPSTTTTYTVTGTGANGCINSAEVTVTVNPLPTVTASPNVSICSGSSATLTGSGAGTYEWSPSTGLNTTTGANVIANPSSTTTYTVTGTDANGCTNSAAVTVTVNPITTVDAGADQSIYSGCLTQSATLTATASGGNEPYTYSWSPGGETTQSINVTPSSTTAYTVTVTNASGCSSSDQVEVEVIPVSISVNAGEDQSIYGGCVTQSATLTASASGGFGSTYFWSPGGETTQSITVAPSGTTTYTVTVTNSLGCSSSDEVIVNVTPVSISVDAGDDQSLFAGCSTQGTTITASVAGGFDPTYFWSPGGETTQTISVNPSSTTTYTVTVTNSFGCSSSDEVVVNVTPVDLSVNAGSDTTIYLGYGPQSTTLTAEASGGNSPSYLWSPGGATTQSITVSPSTTTVYTVQVTNSIGCVTTDEVQVFVYDTRCGNNGNKVLVCHNGKTICISESAVSSHLNHGDHLDSCNGGPDNMMGVEIISEIPDDYMLHANYPNPFNPVTTMKYDLPFDSEVTLTVYDMLGREVVTLVNEMKSAGRYSVTFNAAGLPSGMYFYKIKAHDFVQVRKMILLK